MDRCFSLSEIKALQELLVPPNDGSDSEDDLPQTGSRKLGPGDIGSPKPAGQEHSIPQTRLKSERDDIWDPAEVMTNQIAEVLDPREVPEYEIKYKQAVTTEDVYLSVSKKKLLLLNKSCIRA